ncbi:MAG: bifunctional aspartate kinase/homoserine dehydrogenase I, partial [Bacteroidales bacterium]
MKVLKFGGSSVGSSDRIKAVTRIIAAHPLPLVVVVSAFQGVTDSLKNISDIAAGHDPVYKSMAGDLKERHLIVARQLLAGETLTGILAVIDEIFSELSQTLDGIYLLRELSKYSLDK